MPNYRVKWEIDLDANDPQDAARRALEIQRDPDSIATFFEVLETPGWVYTIDLSKEK